MDEKPLQFLHSTFFHYANNFEVPEEEWDDGATLCDPDGVLLEAGGTRSVSMRIVSSRRPASSIRLSSWSRIAVS